MTEGVVDSSGLGGRLSRLWAPYRLAYVTGEPATDGPDGCPFCTIPKMPDDQSLVVARGELVYAVLNLHPYNPGHLMVVPYRHVSELEDLTLDESTELLLITSDAFVTVSEVAQLAGVGHLGRFSIRYRKRFGESPTHTLARRRRLSA